MGGLGEQVPPVVGVPMALLRVRTHSSRSVWELVMKTYGERSRSLLLPGGHTHATYNMHHTSYNI